MKNYIELRPHHFLCLPGYKGFSYNKEHINSWDDVASLLSRYPNIKVKVVSGQDTLCTKCPNNKNNSRTCNESMLAALDNKVKEILNLEENVFYRYDELNDKLRTIMNPQKHEHLCGECQWRAIGLCKDTFEKVVEKVPELV